MKKDNAFLGTDPVGKLLLRLAIPTIAAQLINMLYNIVDRIYIGHMPVDGDLALTGVGVCMPIILIVSAFAAFISSGGAPRASIFMGKDDIDSAEKTLSSCFIMQVIMSVVLTIVLLIWHEDLLMMFGASENTIDFATSYIKIYAIGTIFVQLTLGMSAYITAQGFAKEGMLTVTIGAVCNIVLDPIFIFAFNMGVRGAALATIISQGISCIWVLYFLTGKKTVLRLNLKKLRFHANLAIPCLALGLAPFIMQSSESIISACFNSSLLNYGGDVAVGAMTILTSVMQFAMMPLQGLSQGAQPILSYNFGAQRISRVKGTFRLLLISSLTYSTVLWAFIMLFPRAFASIFTTDAILLDFTMNALRVYCAVLCVFGIQIACQMTFVALGNAKSSILVAVMRKFILLIPLIYIMPNFMSDKTMAVYTAEPVADILAVTFTAVLFVFQFKKALGNYKLCDLHTHSIYSDGTCTPKEILEQAQSIGLGAVALCDHNTIAGIPEFLENSKDYDVEAVPGVEITAEYSEHEVHILGLFIDPDKYDILNDFLDKIKERKLISYNELYKKLTQDGYDISYDNIFKQAKTGSINRVHFAQELVRCNYAQSISECFDTLLKENGNYYTPAKRCDAFDVISMLSSIGAVPVLAHPFLNLDETQLYDFLTKAKSHGLCAIETNYSLFDKKQTKRAISISKRANLLTSGGSDFHSDNKPDIKLGTGKGELKVPYEYCLNLKACAKQN